MGKLSLKSIFSAPLIIFSSLRKIKINGFVGGLIFGAIFSLFVNIVTIQVQESIQKQRILEAVENEILSNVLMANSISTLNNDNVSKKDIPNMFHNFRRYRNDLWTQSTEPLQYLVQLEPNIQTKVILYYTHVIENTNSMVAKTEKIADKMLENCYNFAVLNETEKKECNQWYWSVLGWETDSSLDMAKQGLDVLEVFHPTKDRLNNAFLKLLMGGKSTMVLSGK